MNAFIQVRAVNWIHLSGQVERVWEGREEERERGRGGEGEGERVHEGSGMIMHCMCSIVFICSYAHMSGLCNAHNCMYIQASYEVDEDVLLTVRLAVDGQDVGHGLKPDRRTVSLNLSQQFPQGILCPA